MTAPQNAGHGSQESQESQDLVDVHAGGAITLRQTRMITILDGLGGALSLNLTQPGLDALAHACNALLLDTLPPGACLLSVRVGDDMYLLRRVIDPPAFIGITRVGARAQEVALSETVVRLVAGLVEQTAHLRARPAGRAHQYPDE